MPMRRSDSSSKQPISLQEWVASRIPCWERTAKADRQYREQQLRQLGRMLEWDQVSRMQLEAQRQVNLLLARHRKPTT